jgi:2'-5' RNA ligase
MIRAFLAVELPDDLRTGLGQVQQDLKHRLSRSFSKDIRISWVQPAAIHLTIKFLGDMDEQLIDPLRAAIEQAAEGRPAIQIPLERFGLFPRPQQPRVLWVGPPEPWERSGEAERLAELHRVVEEGCRSMGFAPDNRPLSPHLTLARIKEGERQVGQALAKSGVLDLPLAIGRLEINAIVLMKSDLRSAGPVYTKLWEIRYAWTRFPPPAPV